MAVSSDKNGTSDSGHEAQPRMTREAVARDADQSTCFHLGLRQAESTALLFDIGNEGGLSVRELAMLQHAIGRFALPLLR